MTSIASPVSLSPNLNHEMGSPFAGNKQAWLYALEKTVANTALAETELFTMASKNSVFGHKHENARGVLTSKSQLHQSSSDLNRVSASLQNGVPSLGAQTSGSVINNFSSAQKTSLAGLTSGYLTIPMASLKTVPASKELLPPLLFDINKYAKQNIVMLNSFAGAEVWIRDVHTPRYKLMEIVKDIRHSMGQLGVGLVRIVLNGKEAFNQESLKG